MAQTTTVESASPKSLPARLFGVLMTPRTAYSGIAARPRILGALAVVLFVTVTGAFTFSSTEVGKQAILDQQVRQAESFGRTLNEEQYRRLEGMAAYMPYIGAAMQLVSLPLVALIVAGVAFAVFNAALGGDATFKQVYAVVVHSGVVIIVQQFFTLPLAYARETLSSPTNLMVFLPFLEEDTFLARLLGSIDLFLIWWAINLSIGLAILYKRRTSPVAATLLVIYVVIGFLIAAVKTAFAGA